MANPCEASRKAGGSLPYLAQSLETLARGDALRRRRNQPLLISPQASKANDEGSGTAETA